MLGWWAAIWTGYDQEFPNDFAAFYYMAWGLTHYGMGLNHSLYALNIQYALESQLHHGSAYLEIPFVNPPLAAWLIMPFSELPLRAAYLTWDVVGFVLEGLGLWWLVRLAGDKRMMKLVALAAWSSYPTYIALGQGQFDFLWPLAVALVWSAATITVPIKYVPRAAVGALLAAIKPDLLIGFLVPAAFAWKRGWVRTLVITWAIFALMVVAILGPVGLRQVLHIELFTIAQRFPPTNDLTILGFFWRLLGPGRLASDLALLGIPVALVVLAVAWWRNPPQSRSDWYLSLTTVTCVSLLIAPHDLAQGLILLGPAAIWAGSAFGLLRKRLMPIAIWIVVINFSVLLDLSPHMYHFPIKFTPLLLLGAAWAAWHSRQPTATPND